MHRHSVVEHTKNTLCPATCMKCVVSERRATSRRFGVGHETCAGKSSLAVDRVLVHRHNVVGTYSSKLFSLTTCMIYIAIPIVTRMITIVSEGQGQWPTHRRRPQSVHRHIVSHHRPPSRAPSQRCCYIPRSLCTTTVFLCIVSEERAKSRRVHAGHEPCAGT